MDCSPPGSSVHEILQARILEWIAISVSGAPIGEVRFGLPRSKGGPLLHFPPPAIHVHYHQSVPLLCKALLLPDCLIVSHLRGHCSSDLNISNMLPKDLSFRIDNFILKIIYLQI